MCFLVSFSFISYLSLVVDEGDAQIRHGSEDGHQGLDRVAVHNGPVLFEIIGRETALVDDPICHENERNGYKLHAPKWLLSLIKDDDSLHLFDDGRFARFTSAYTTRKRNTNKSHHHFIHFHHDSKRGRGGGGACVGSHLVVLIRPLPIHFVYTNGTSAVASLSFSPHVSSLSLSLFLCMQQKLKLALPLPFFFFSFIPLLLLCLLACSSGV